ncbi:hypothetical protein [Corallococcus sp. CA054B]|uniref:hypothetical protein n=1 Tax=Corallococcus sp. CA054B TaxID=2316734 RepID=UPI0011C49331|nr:hypothetical protein [Corallococcus sp. CA054B]
MASSLFHRSGDVVDNAFPPVEPAVASELHRDPNGVVDEFNDAEVRDAGFWRVGRIISDSAKDLIFASHRTDGRNENLTQLTASLASQGACHEVATSAIE